MNQEIISTVVQIQTDCDLCNFVGDLSAEYLKDALIGAYPFIENCASIEAVEETENGLIKRIRFVEKTEKLG